MKIALRFLSSSKGQTILIVLGIAIGVSVQVFVGSLIGSLQKSLVDRTIGRSPHVTLVPSLENGTIDGWEAIVQEIEGVDGISKISPAADSPVFLLSGSRTYSLLIRGFDIERADGIYDLSRALYKGDLPQGSRGTMLGRELAEDLSIDVGSTVRIMVPNGTVFSLTVVGLYDLKVAGLNKAWAVADLSAVQDMLGMGDKVSSIEMQVKDVFSADSVAKKVEKSIGRTDLAVVNWKDENQQLLSGLQGQSSSSYMIQVFVMLSVVIGIASVLAITVMQKSRQLGILKAMGIMDREASMIFLFQGAFVGIGGAVMGVILGILLLVSFTIFARGADGSPIVPIHFDAVFIIASGVLAVLSATLAALIPARRSARLSPMEVIRNG